MTATLEELGWSPWFSDRLAAIGEPKLRPARVCVERRGVYAVLGLEDEPVAARVSGRLRHEARDRRDFPAVGDWVAVCPRGAIRHLLERHTSVVRQTEHRGAQVLAANVDLVFVVTSLNQEFNPWRLTRYVAACRSGGAKPVIVLNKSDLSDDPDAFARRVSEAVPGVAIETTCAIRPDIDGLHAHLERGRTSAFLGSSGVGKSTLVNALIGEPVQTVAAVRETDDKGRHTTTHRELFVLPGGCGLLIDTPGMRELQLVDDAGVAETFNDIEELAQACRFRNCSHRQEPGCGVAGRVSEARLDRWRKLHQGSEGG